MENKIKTESDVNQAAVQVLKHTPWRKGDARKISLESLCSTPIDTRAYPSLLDIDKISVPPHCWVITIHDV